MKKGLTSIIITCFDHSQSARHISMLCAANIVRYTNPKEYELIVVDAAPTKEGDKVKYPFRDDYKIFNFKKFLELDPDPGYYAGMNKAAKYAKGEYICFIENDVFVNFGWLEDLRWYLENDKCDAIMPDQYPCTYETQIKYMMMSLEDALGKGGREQGLILMKRSVFDAIGGWDKNLPKGYGWKHFYEQIADNGFDCNVTCATSISHITGVSFFDSMENDYQRFSKILREEEKFRNGK